MKQSGILFSHIYLKIIIYVDDQNLVILIELYTYKVFITKEWNT
jgi:hypothetical protein